MRALLALMLTLLPGLAWAHPGHMIEVAGHDHVAAGVAIGVAIGVAAVLVLTELVDGFIARQLHATSALGARLDTIADAVMDGYRADQHGSVCREGHRSRSNNILEEYAFCGEFVDMGRLDLLIAQEAVVGPGMIIADDEDDVRSLGEERSRKQQGESHRRK